MKLLQYNFFIQCTVHTLHYQSYLQKYTLKWCGHIENIINLLFIYYIYIITVIY